MHHSTDRITHTTAFVAPVVEHWLEREIAQWVDSKRGNQLPSLHGLLFPIRSCQVRLTCTFRASCCSARLSRAQFLCPGHDFQLVARGLLYAQFHRQDSTKLHLAPKERLRQKSWYVYKEIPNPCDRSHEYNNILQRSKQQRSEM